jgi:hypothetical protein
MPLFQFDFTVEYRPGSKHGNADAMSRCLNPRECDCPETDHLEYLKCGPCAKCTKRAWSVFNSKIKCRKDFNPSGNPSFGFFKAKEPNQCLVICSDSKSSAQQVLKKLKQAFISPEIMAYPEDHGDFILDTDACDSSSIVHFSGFSFKPASRIL